MDTDGEKNLYTYVRRNEMSKFKINRKVTQDECSWLDEDFEIGQIVFEYFGCTYGCISSSGLPVTFAPDETPFFEIPADALTEMQ